MNSSMPFVAISIFFLMSFSFGKVQEHRVKFIKKPLKITTTKASPPRLAFIQVLSYEKKNEKLVPSEPIKAVNLTEVISKRQLRPLAFVLQRRQVSIPEILITRAEIYNQPFAGLSQVPKSVRLNQEMRSAAAQEVSSNTVWPESLTEKEKRWLDQANLTSNDFEVFNEAAVDPVATNMQAQIAAELSRPSKDALPGWIISKPSSAGPSPSVPRQNPEGASDTSGKRSFQNFSIQGRIGLGSGLILGAGEHIEIHWTREGASKVAGTVSLENDARYEVTVPELVGSVNAEMYDSSGRMKARGSLRLSQNSSSGDITLHSQRSLAQKSGDFYNSSSQLFASLPFKKSKNLLIKTKVSIDNQAEFKSDDQSSLAIDGVSPNSTAFGFTRAKGYYPSIHWMSTGAPKSSPLVPASTVNAWKDIIRNQRNLTPVQGSDGAFVLGQATREGQPIAGVQVEMIQNPETRPVYLNQLLIPDPSLTATSSNGYYIFMDLEDGYYSVRATKGNFFFGFSNFLAEADSISFSNLQEASLLLPFDIRVFDAFQGNDELAAVDLQGLSAPVDVEGYSLIQHPATDEIEFVQVQPRNPEMSPSLFVMRGEDDYLHLPLVRKNWLEQMAATSQLSPQPGTGTILGFVSKGNYQIVLPHLIEQAPVTVIFFDASGNRVEQPVENGGFIAFNVPASAHTIVVRDNFGETASQIIPVDADRMTTVRFLF